MIVRTGNKQNIRLELKSKKLKSGRCQVKFSAIDQETFYGYMMVESATSVKDVIRMLQRRLENGARFGVCQDGPP